jgi:drug/metabolite transporter (DMT)-like permease|tara:strand:+ start:81 stop:908 length:828 start_codon:yes stop_codon:yes gene_type:complete
MITAIAGVLLFGIADALWRPSILNHGQHKVLLHRTGLTTLILGLYLLLDIQHFKFNIPMIGVGILSGVIAGFGLYFLVKAFSLETTTNVLFLNIFTLLIAQLFSFILFQETIQWKYYPIQIGLSILTVLCFNGFDFKLRKGLIFGLLASICFGIAYPLAGIPIKEIGFKTTIFIQEMTILTMFLCFGYFVKKTKIDLKIYLDIKILALSVLSAIAVILFFYSYTVIEIYKVNLISNFHPVGGMIVSIILFDERLTKYQILGVVSSIIVCLSIFVN